MLGRLEYQRGNFDAALQVFKGIDIKLLTPRITKAIVDRTRPCNKPPRSSKAVTLPPPTSMSMHSVSLLLEAILLKARSLEELGSCKGIIYTKRLLLLEDSVLTLLLFFFFNRSCRGMQTNLGHG